MLAACVLAGAFPAGVALGDAADTMHLADEPGNWFRSQATGTPLAVVSPGDRVDFVIGNCCTSTRHTVTLLLKPPGSAIALDQGSSQMGTPSLEFDLPGIYVLVCKIHPYMTAVVAVTDEQGNIPDVTAAQLPFIGHLGIEALPATAVLGVMTTVAATEGEKRAKWDILGPDDEMRPGVSGVGEIWINTQFERVPGQVDDHDVEKPGIPLSAERAMAVVEDSPAGLNKIDEDPTGAGENHPHGHWLTCGLGDRAIVPNVFKGVGFAGSIGIVDTETGHLLGEFTHDADDPLRSALFMPIAGTHPVDGR
jgi:plastocyanin